MLLGPVNPVFSHPWVNPYVGRRCSQKWDNVSFLNQPPQEDVTNQSNDSKISMPSAPCFTLLEISPQACQRARRAPMRPLQYSRGFDRPPSDLQAHRARDGQSWRPDDALPSLPRSAPRNQGRDEKSAPETTKTHQPALFIGQLGQVSINGLHDSTDSKLDGQNGATLPLRPRYPR